MVMGMPSNAVVSWLNESASRVEKTKFGELYNGVMEHTRDAGAMFDHSKKIMTRTVNHLPYDIAGMNKEGNEWRERRDEEKEKYRDGRRGWSGGEEEGRRRGWVGGGDRDDGRQDSSSKGWMSNDENNDRWRDEGRRYSGVDSKSQDIGDDNERERGGTGICFNNVTFFRYRW